MFIHYTFLGQTSKYLDRIFILEPAEDLSISYGTSSLNFPKNVHCQMSEIIQ